MSQGSFTQKFQKAFLKPSIVSPTPKAKTKVEKNRFIKRRLFENRDDSTMKILKNW